MWKSSSRCEPVLLLLLPSLITSCFSSFFPPQEDLICATKANILKNDERIQRLFVSMHLTTWFTCHRKWTPLLSPSHIFLLSSILSPTWSPVLNKYVGGGAISTLLPTSDCHANILTSVLHFHAWWLDFIIEFRCTVVTVTQGSGEYTIMLWKEPKHPLCIDHTNTTCSSSIHGNVPLLIIVPVAKVLSIANALVKECSKCTN